MIIVIEGKRNRQLVIKGLSMLSLIVMFWLYYNHMSNRFQQQNKQLVSQLHLKKENMAISKKQKIEKTIYKEAVIIADLIEQKNIQSMKIVKDKLLIVCDFDTDIEPVLIRYGVNAMVKNTDKNIKLALDLKVIVENKYES
jgi:hypothetical protein